jgi:hypothetical protein
MAEALVRDLAGQVRHTQHAEDHMRRLLADAYSALPASPHLQVLGKNGDTFIILLSSIITPRPAI